jgi:hypothetical protein
VVNYRRANRAGRTRGNRDYGRARYRALGVESVGRVTAAILVIVVLLTTGLALASASARALPSGSNFPGVRGEVSPSGGRPSGESSACAAVLAENPEANSSLFQEVCNEPAFLSAVQEWGTSSFWYAEGVSHGYRDLYYTFTGPVACQNASEGTQCEEEEYWAANTTTNSVSGPFYSQYPEACACEYQPAPSPTEAVLLVPLALLVAAGGLIGGALAVIIATLGRSVRSRDSSRRSSPPSDRPSEPPGSSK